MKNLSSLRHLSLISLCTALGLYACSEKKKFGGDVSVGSDKKPKVADVEKGEIAPVPSSKPVEVPTVDKTVDAAPPPKPVCDLNQKAVTNIVLLDNPSIKANQPAGQQVIRYEVSLLSCDDGRVLPLKDQNFQFDVNAVSRQGDMSYVALDATTSKEISNGTLRHVTGADLFGNVGPTWGRWENGSFSLPEGHAKIIMVLALDQIDKSISADPTIIESFFRIGDTKAVKQTLPFVP